jgi:hypothetical protein
MAPAAPAQRFDRVDELLEARQVLDLLENEFGADVPKRQQLVREQRLFCVVSGGDELYPTFQWHEGRLVAGLQGVLNILTPYRSAWNILAWLTANNRHLEGTRPVDLLIVAAANVSRAARLELQEQSINSDANRRI